jgi:hypothetical protein
MPEEKKPFQVFTVARGITKDVITRSEGAVIEHEHRTLGADLGITIANYFGFEVQDIMPDEKGEPQAEKHSLQVVAMTVAEFERLKDIEWRYKDLNDEEVE